MKITRKEIDASRKFARKQFKIFKGKRKWVTTRYKGFYSKTLV